jgi:hypothetical protein
VALRKQRTRALGLAAALAAALTAAGCTHAPAQSTGGVASAPSATASADAAGHPAGPAITAAQARQVFDTYVATTARAARTNDASLALSLLTGTPHAVAAAALGRHPVTVAGTSSGSAYSSSLTVTVGQARYSYGPPTFYLPEQAGYPHFFVADVTQTLADVPADGRATITAGGVRIPADGPALLLFEQSAASGPWLLASDSRLPPGASPPRLARNSAGAIPVVQPSAAAFLAPPDDVGALQAAVVDDGPSSADTKAVADGPLTTGMYQGALDHVDGMRAPRGDVYQWDLAGSTLPEFALQTAAGGALVFYAMTLNTTVAVPDYVNKADPVHSGPAIAEPADVQSLLPKGQPAPLIDLQSQQTLSFVAVDPDPSTAKVQVIAMGGGLTSASAS